MRIGFLGNQNNFPFILARGLRRLGHDVRVVIDCTHPLDRPESRYSDISYPYPDWIRETPPVNLEDIVFDRQPWKEAVAHVADCDALVLNKFAYDAATRLRIPALALVTGADVECYANPHAAEAFACHQTRDARGRQWVRTAFCPGPIDATFLSQLVSQLPMPLYRTWHKQFFRLFVRRQRAGLRHAIAISALPDGTSVPMAEVMRSCVRPGAKRLHLLMADVEWVVPSPAPNNPVLRIFNAARVLWQRPFPPTVGDWENKGTDVLLKGVALWHRRTGRALDVRLVEKGPSVPATKVLTRELGIGHLVHWQPEMTQAEVFTEYTRADIVAEQCGDHVLGMAGYEAMASGRPVIANARPELYGPLLGTPVPVAQARTPEEIAARLDHLSDPAERARLAAEGRRFVEHFLSVEAVARQVSDVLEAAVAARRATPARLAA